MVTTLYLIRHGETENAEEKRYKGSIDVPLSEKGRKQIERLANYMVQDSLNSPLPPFSKGGMGGLLSAVYCSDLSRALKSAEIIAEPHGLKPVVMQELRERNFGIWEGMSFDEIKKKYPEEFKAWADNPLKFSPIGGESTIEVRDRVVKALDRILTNHLQVGQGSGVRGHEERKSYPLTRDPISIAIVAHGGVNRIILCHLLGIPLENIFRIEQYYGAVNIIEFYDRYPVVKLINYAV